MELLNPSIVRDEAGRYCTSRPVSELELVNFVSSLLDWKYMREQPLTEPASSREYAVLKLGQEEREIFAVAFLDSQHRIISFEKLFFGTLDSAAVHPREVVKRCLQLNTAALIIMHNHPSGVPEPSQADRAITERLKDALSLIDVRILDHIVVGGSQTVSFAERGWL